MRPSPERDRTGRRRFLGVALGAASAGLLPQPAVAGDDTPRDGAIERDGFRLRYRTEGNGPPAIVIGSALYYPRVFSPRLRDHLRLTFLDHRGFAPARGDEPMEAFALEEIVEDVEQARRQLNLGRVVVIGHSGHSYMALEYAKRHPDAVSHVVMIGIAPDLSPAGTEAAERAWAESVDPGRKAAWTESLERMPDAKLATFPPGERFVQDYLRQGPRAWFDYRFDAAPLWNGVEINARMFDHVWGEIFRDIDVTRGLDALDRPVFLSLGRYDYLVAPPSSWDPLRPRFRDLTVRVFERSAHTPPLEEPELFDAELLRWLEARR